MRLFRPVIAITVLFLAFSTSAFSNRAAAQQASLTSACNGNLNVIRVTEVKPGMMSKFMDAYAAQKAWFAAKGTPDKFDLMRVMDQNPSTKAFALSENTLIISHIQPAVRPGKGLPRDAAFAAFGTAMKDSSTTKSEYVSCIVNK